MFLQHHVYQLFNRNANTIRTLTGRLTVTSRQLAYHLKFNELCFHSCWPQFQSKAPSQQSVFQECISPGIGVKLLISTPISRLHVVAQVVCLLAQDTTQHSGSNDGISHLGFTTGAAKITGLYEVGFIPQPQLQAQCPSWYLRCIHEDCCSVSLGTMGFKRNSGTTVGMSGIVMTDILLWVGLSHWFVDVIAMTHDLKLLPAPSGLRAHFTRDMAATGSWFNTGVFPRNIIWMLSHKRHFCPAHWTG